MKINNASGSYNLKVDEKELQELQKTQNQIPNSILASDSIKSDNEGFVKTKTDSQKSDSQIEQLEKQLKETESHNGLIGGLWDGFKNLTGIGAGSDKAQKKIEEFKSGKIKIEEVKKAVEDYKNGQKQSVDMVADIGSGIAAFAAFSVCTGLGIVAAPFTAGASLGLVAAGIAVAGAAGAASKVAIKGADALVGGRKYDSAGYDLATGGVNGLFAPITAGIGGAVGKTIASRVGVTAAREGGEVLIKEGLEETAKGAITKTLLTTNVSYTGGTIFARGAALGADMATNGAISGGVDSATRYIAGDSDNKSVSGLLSSVGEGAVSGLIAAPIIGGGMRLVGNKIGTMTNKVANKVETSYTKAKSNFMNVPVVENPDAEVLNSAVELFKQASNIVDNLQSTLDNNPLESVLGFSSNTGDVPDVIIKSIDLSQQLPKTKVYQELGNLPDSVKNVIDTLGNEVTLLDDGMKSMILNMPKAKLENSLDELSKYGDELIKFGDELDSLYRNLSGQVNSIKTSAKKSGIIDTAKVLAGRLNKRINTKGFEELSKEAKIQAIVEDSNILLAKFAQTMSSDESLPADAQKLLKQFTSNCTVSREMPEAQILTDELYGKGKYTLLKSFGAGTIGETYLAKDSSGQEVVIKMLKDGVTPEKFAEDRKAFTGYISEYVTDPAQKEYKLNLINGMFDAWDTELNFALEAKAAQEMAVGAKRFNVAQTLEVGTKNGQNISLVMQKAKGVRLDTLIDMIKLYRENPSEYFTKYSKEFEANPALKTPEKWMNDLPIAYQKAQNEQVMFTGKNGKKRIQGDPHGGNVFVDFDSKTGKPIITYIDLGNSIERTDKEVLQDLNLSLNTMFGNTSGIANFMLDGAVLPNGANKVELANKFAQLLDEKLFKADINLMNVVYTQTTIDGIMKDLNIIPKSSDSNLLKATFQRVKTLREICLATGNQENRVVDMKDLCLGILKSFKTNPKETLKTIKPIIQWACENHNHAMTTAFQMVMNYADVQ